MPNEILDDNFNEAENENFTFVLTKKSTLQLLEAAKWAKTSVLFIIGLNVLKLFRFLVWFFLLERNILSENWAYNILSIIEPVVIILVSCLLYSFSDSFIKGYEYDKDDLVDKSLMNLHKFYKFSVIIVGITSLILEIYLFHRNGLFYLILTYLIFIIPVGLLVLFFFQNKFPNSEVSDIQNNSAENK